MEKLLKTVVASVVMTAAFVQPAFAGVFAFTATLTAAAENNPANTSTGTGSALVTVDDVLNTMRVQINFAGLTSGTNGAHIHCCLPTPFANVNAGVATSTPSFLGFPLGVTSGAYDATLDMTLASSYNQGATAFLFQNGNNPLTAEATLFAGIENGKTYLNLHTINFPGGEIRGFLVPVPEPITLSLFGTGLAGAAFFRKRRKAKA